MYNTYRTYPCPYCVNTSFYNGYNINQSPYSTDTPEYGLDFSRHFSDQCIPFDEELDYDYRLDTSQSAKNSETIDLMDYGPQPFVVDIDEATKQNDTFRTALWTGSHLQVTLMSINVGEDIGLENHPDTDQFIRVEDGQGLVRMGRSRENLDFQARVTDDFAILIPAGTWHNIINTDNVPLKVYSIYAPPHHPSGTVHETKADAQAAEEHHDQ